MNTRILFPLAVLLVGLHTSASAADRKPNFIVVYTDNLGYGDIEPFGSTVHRTPNLNRMAKEGRKFTHFCVTAGVCTPSRSSIMTGSYSQRVQMHDNPRDGWVLRPVSPYGLHPDEVTVAEVLKGAGYATGIIGKWHLGDQLEFMPNQQGFDYFFGIPYSDDMTQEAGERAAARMKKNPGAPNLGGLAWPPLPLLENEKVIEAPVDRDGLTKRYTEKALEWIEDNHEKPFFLYFPQAMPGSTSKPFSSPEFRGKSKNGPWGDSIEELDWSQGQLLDKLVELGIAENTLVIWTSDNGAPINRTPGDVSRGSNQPLHGRGYTTAEGAFRVPTIMWWPGTIAAGTECAELCTTMDLLPTFAGVVGGDVPTGRKIDGKNILPLIKGEADAKSPYEAFFYYDGPQLQAVRSGPWKLFVPLESFRNHPHFGRDDGSGEKALLFNVVDDIASENDVADVHPDIVEKLMGFAEAARADLGDMNRKGSGQRAIGKNANPTPRVHSDAKQ
ncbi:sulfatase [Verrucomicrobiales bacterium]|jgi:arylsulfatase A|nr:sulfatase [Verrucomicrobiales bacterium]MDB2496603.1 sulfatase [Verrucomicrobiales bacterium]MDB2642604.1 sulfatase [bacterium]MDB3940105.1 sulfatase [Verrucomicrobiales bacterium]